MAESRGRSELPQRRAFEHAGAAVGREQRGTLGAHFRGRARSSAGAACGAQQYRGGACKGQSEDSATHPGHRQIGTGRRATSATASFSHRHSRAVIAICEHRGSHAATRSRQNECGMRRAPSHTSGRGRARAGPVHVPFRVSRGSHRERQPCRIPVDAHLFSDPLPTGRKNRKKQFTA